MSEALRSGAEPELRLMKSMQIQGLIQNLH